MRYFLVLSFLCLYNLSNAQVFDSVSIFFDIGKYELSGATIQKLNTLAQRLEQYEQQKILIYGYADYLGENKPNLNLSQQRAKVVLDYLCKRQIDKKRFLVVEGLGQQEKTKADLVHGDSLNRRTLILLPQRKSNNNIAVPTEKLTNHNNIADVSNIESVINNTPVNTTLVLNDIYFELHTPMLSVESRPMLSKLLSVMKQNQNLKIAIEGHICCNALDGYNKNTTAYKLSILRAKKIYDYLLNNGIDEKRISYAGFGRTRPIFPDELNDEEMAANRRVELRVLNK